MQNYSTENYPSSADMEIYRYLAASGGSNNDMLTWPPNYSHYSGAGSGSSSSFCPAGMMMSETAEAKAMAASRIHHKEAEKRRRERINSHLDRLRSLLPCTSKTDKATLLSKVVQRVLELKRQTSELLQVDNLLIPSESDDFAVCYIANKQSSNEEEDNNDNDNENKVILKASLCCEDRPDLFSDLNSVLDSLNLKTLRADISTLGGRVQSVLVVSADSNRESEECAVFLRDALKGIVQRSGSEERLKRRRRVFDTNC